MTQNDNLKATELRINNSVQYNFNMTGWSNVVICYHDFIEFERLKGVSRPYRPIPLTEEWFDLNINYKKSEWNFIGYGTRIIVQHNTFKGIKLEHLPNNQVGFYWGNELISFKDYVHQLQNLYFALTQKELIYG